MSWSTSDQAAAVAEFQNFTQQTQAAYAAYESGLRSGVPGTTQAALEDVLRRWRGALQVLRARSDGMVANESTVDNMNQLVASIQEEKAILRKLRSEAVTRGDQASSVNPKVRPSPYVNILGLQRTFRPSTRMNIMIASIVFGVLAVSIAGFMGYRVATGGIAAAMPASYPGSSFSRGGARSAKNSG